MNNKKYLIVLATVATPAVAWAQGLKDYIQEAGRIVYILIPMSISAAVLFFFWGLAKFILKAGSDDGRDEGKEVMKWGIVSLFVIASIWGIIAFIQSELRITGERILF